MISVNIKHSGVMTPHREDYYSSIPIENLVLSSNVSRTEESRDRQLSSDENQFLPILSPSLNLFWPWLTVLVHHQNTDFSEVLALCWFSVLDPQGEPGRLT